MKSLNFYYAIILLVLTTLSGCDRLTSATPLPSGETIAEIQGAGHISPYENRPVYHVHGIVTTIRSDGFYLQSLKPDDDPATSEGIFVWMKLVPSVNPGDEILVNAMVKEAIPGGSGTGNLSITQLENPYIVVISEGNALPDPLIIGEGGRVPPDTVIDDDTDGLVGKGVHFDPENDGLDFYESLEGMFVQVNNATVVGATTQYKEITLLSDFGVNAGVRTSRGGIVVQADDFNPERIILDDALRQLPFVQVGDTASEPIIGVIDYNFGNFKLQPTVKVQFESGGLAPEGSIEPTTANQLRVVSYNVQNLSVLEPERVAVLADQIVMLMGSPEIIGLQEIMDDDGAISTQAISADETFQAIIDAVLVAGGPQYGFVDIDPLPDRDGGIPGGNIRVGFLYRLDVGLSLRDAPAGDAVSKTSVIAVEGKPALSLNPGRVDPSNLAFTDSRKPLVVEFLLNGESIFIINNHFNSKGGDYPLFGSYQPPILESAVQRSFQAEVVHDFVSQILAIDSGAQVIVLGDLNDFQFSEPLTQLAGNLLGNLFETLPLGERYTYVYDGNSQALDHILVSARLRENLAGIDVLHINSEFDYQLRFSDHDPILATFSLE